jgi:hypothetical protein
MHLPKKGAPLQTSKYTGLGLLDMPFPNVAVVNPYSYDPRTNGSIYAVSTAQSAIAKFESLLIRPDDFTNRDRLAYLWSKSDSESGRGAGKTALLRYFRHRINHDWGHTEFKGQFSAVVVYVGFQTQIKQRHMEQLALSALVDVCRNGVLDASRAALRLAALPEDKVDVILAGPDGTPEPENLLNDQILQKHGVNPASLDEEVASTLRSAGVKAPVAQALAQGTFEDYLKSLRKDRSLEPLYVPHDTKILDYSRTLLFDDIVNYLRAANYRGGYLFIDDIENLVDKMPRKAKIEFAKNFGLCTVRPGYANTAHGFFSNVLTTHSQASISLAQAWVDAGLAAIAQLDPGSSNSVELPFPSKEQARGILVAHLNYYRINKTELESIKPFTQDGIDALLGQTLVHPRVTLSNAAKVMQYAVDKQLTVINGECVKAAVAIKTQTEKTTSLYTR